MPTTEELHELAVRALQDFYRDRSVTMTEKLTGLQALRAELDELIKQAEREAGAEQDQAEHDEEDTSAEISQ